MQLYKIEEILPENLQYIIPPFTTINSEKRIEEIAADYGIHLYKEDTISYVIYTLLSAKKIRIKGQFGQINTTIELNFSDSPKNESFSDQYKNIIDTIAEEIDFVNITYGDKINSSDFVNKLLSIIDKY